MGAKTADILLSACGYNNHGHEPVVEKGAVIAQKRPFPGRVVGDIEVLILLYRTSAPTFLFSVYPGISRE